MCYNLPMKRIYLDNAATSFPKVPGTAYILRDFLEKDCTNISRTTGQNGTDVYEKITALRSGIAGLLNLSTPESVILNSSRNISRCADQNGFCLRSDQFRNPVCENEALSVAGDP